MSPARKLDRFVPLRLADSRIDRQWEAVAARLAAPSRGRGFGRRIALAGAAALAAAAVVAVAVRLQAPGGSAPALAEGTVIASTTDAVAVALDDGTRIEVAPQSMVVLAELRAGAVRVDLRRGAASFDVPPSPDRRFMVSAADVLVTVVSTRFRVERDREDVVRVRVEQGTVEVASGGGSGASRLVTAGESWTSGRPAVRAPVAAPVDGADDASDGGGPEAGSVSAPPSGPAPDPETATAPELVDMVLAARRGGLAQDAAAACAALLRRFPEDARGDLAGCDPDRVVAVTAGKVHTCALTAEGRVLCWGYNGSGQIGIDPADVPASVLPLYAGDLDAVAQIDAGAYHTCAVRRSGEVWCWGANFMRQADPSRADERVGPTRVAGIDGAVEVVAGFWHDCARLASGELRCWGADGKGQLGNGAFGGQSPPLAVAGVLAARGLAAGQHHSCAVLADGTARCWGFNGKGELGDGRKVDSAAPVTVTGLSGVALLAAGGGHEPDDDSGGHTCAASRAGPVWCWGRGESGQLGQGANSDSTSPVAVHGLGDIVRIAAGGRHTCVVTAAGSVACWGRNAYGQLGDGTTVSRSTPLTVDGLAGAVDVALGLEHTCALLGDGDLWCWGGNMGGQLGNASLESQARPVRVDLP